MNTLILLTVHCIKEGNTDIKFITTELFLLPKRSSCSRALFMVSLMVYIWTDLFMGQNVNV